MSEHGWLIGEDLSQLHAQGLNEYDQLTIGYAAVTFLDLRDGVLAGIPSRPPASRGELRLRQALFPTQLTYPWTDDVLVHDETSEIGS